MSTVNGLEPLEVTITSNFFILPTNWWNNVLILNVFKSLQIYTLSGRSQSTFIVITINDFWVSPLMEQIKGFEEEPKDSLCFVFKFKSLSYQVWA